MLTREGYPNRKRLSLGSALESSRMLIATHDGSFHADEVFAVAALGLLGEPVEVVRTRDRDAIARADSARRRRLSR